MLIHREERERRKWVQGILVSLRPRKVMVEGCKHEGNVTPEGVYVRWIMLIRRTGS